MPAKTFCSNRGFAGDGEPRTPAIAAAATRAPARRRVPAERRRQNQTVFAQSVASSDRFLLIDVLSRPQKCSRREKGSRALIVLPGLCCRRIEQARQVACGATQSFLTAVPRSSYSCGRFSVVRCGGCTHTRGSTRAWEAFTTALLHSRCRSGGCAAGVAAVADCGSVGRPAWNIGILAPFIGQIGFRP
jgi:hypothetical protein